MKQRTIVKGLLAGMLLTLVLSGCGPVVAPKESIEERYAETFRKAQQFLGTTGYSAGPPSVTSPSSPSQPPKGPGGPDKPGGGRCGAERTAYEKARKEALKAHVLYYGVKMKIMSLAAHIPLLKRELEQLVREREAAENRGDLRGADVLTKDIERLQRAIISSQEELAVAEEMITELREALKAAEQAEDDAEVALMECEARR